MNDKSLDIFLMVLFGVGGITILTVAWAQPMPLLERVVTTSIGLVGPFWVLARALSLTSVVAKTGVRKNLAEVGAKKKPH